MCGIAGVLALNEEGRSFLDNIEKGTACLNKRGPDHSAVYRHGNIALGHARLSIIDTSPAASQPFTDSSGRYTIVFNGEFFNFREFRNELLSKGITLKSESDTEVLLHLYIKEGEKCLEKVNGFFAFAIYDKIEGSVFLARDRFGIKPFFIYQDESKLIFGSEMKALIAMRIPKIIDEVSLHSYLQLNYIPAPDSIFKNVKKILPGHFLKISNQPKEISASKYYEIPQYNVSNGKTNYSDACNELKTLLDDSVRIRLFADVKVGAFLSGGIDSSIITGLAAKHTKNLKTFSIGFKDEPFFDETHFAKMVAKKHHTDHTVFSLTNEDLFGALYNILDYIDEPFADSSALPVYILSQQTAKEVKVALSGDGADELFGGYNKHMAEFRARNSGLTAQLVGSTKLLWDILPKSRNTAFGKKILQLQKFSEGINLSPKNRYWKWACIRNEKDVSDLLVKNKNSKEVELRKEKILKNISDGKDLNDIFLTDMNLVLPNDMLTKVDMMSMANSLEVRVPFLDYRLVNFAFSLPSEYKINHTLRKRILKDSFREILPDELYSRNKQGFEVPLLKWFRTSLKETITNDLLGRKFIEEQNIFNYSAVEKLLKKMFSNDPADSSARVWNLVVFQYWYKKYMV
jgi:asparagine synthase (glutamine-hydrolysing)